MGVKARYTVYVQVLMSKDMVRSVDEIAEAEGRSRSDVVRELVMDALASRRRRRAR
jgi:metal-responsive CopG/Arc/MetJ family transcriptional regulator